METSVSHSRCSFTPSHCNSCCTTTQAVETMVVSFGQRSISWCRYGFLLTLALCAATSRGGLDWLARERTPQYLIVAASGVAMFVMTLFRPDWKI
ncbi:MAG: hypothetical protein WDN00_02950 [Limisphaerales bacterium]